MRVCRLDVFITQDCDLQIGHDLTTHELSSEIDVTSALRSREAQQKTTVKSARQETLPHAQTPPSLLEIAQSGSTPAQRKNTRQHQSHNVTTCATARTGTLRVYPSAFLAKHACFILRFTTLL